MMADVPEAGAPAVITASCHPVTQGRTPPLAGLTTGQVSLYSMSELA
jgi:hypothetical protein